MDLSNYVDVATRLKLALDKWPDLRVQETGRELLEVGDKQYLVCTVTAWRTADDPIPSIASAWEPLPGVTPYTRNSELMVGFTSALGRARSHRRTRCKPAVTTHRPLQARRSHAQPQWAPLSHNSATARHRPNSECFRR
jgi:hypothetical protein